MEIQDLALRLAAVQNFEGYSFDCQVIPGDVEVLEVTVGDLDEMPCYLSVTDSQLLCITYLFAEQEIKPESRVELLEELLDLNVPMPLSAFARIGERYVVFGALANNSPFDDICREVITLSENAVEALETLQAFLN